MYTYKDFKINKYAYLVESNSDGLYWQDLGIIDTGIVLKTKVLSSSKKTIKVQLAKAEFDGSNTWEDLKNLGFIIFPNARSAEEYTLNRKITKEIRCAFCGTGDTGYTTEQLIRVAGVLGL